MNNNTSKVDIILPNYNSSEFVEKTIKSVINQNFRNWKLVIIDDNSNEKTKKIIRKYQKHKKIKVIWLKKNKGPAYCRNLGISKSFSEYIAFLDSDDIWTRDKLKLQTQFMKTHNHHFTYTNYKTFGAVKRSVTPPSKFSFSTFIRNTSIATSSMIVSRKTIKGIKFTNTNICEDYYFKCKILKRVSFAYCLGVSLTKYRIRNNSLQGNKIKNLYWVWKINSQYNKLNFFSNLLSLFFISINSIKKYGLK